MKKRSTKKWAAIVAVSGAFALTACSAPINVTFVSPRPWQDGGYEKLAYTVNIYDTRDGTEAAKRKVIAVGSLEFELNHNDKYVESIAYSSLAMRFSVTYNDASAEADRGKTDVIESSVTFQSESLATERMHKSVRLAERKDIVDNSYTAYADYFGERKATVTMGETVTQIDIPASTFNDNEMMFYLARATQIDKSAVTYFYMSSVFDSYLNDGKFVNHTMNTRTASELSDMVVGDFVSEFGIEQAENGSYVIPCYVTSVNINATKHGPPYMVYFSEKPFVKDGVSHSKIPVFIGFNEYAGAQVVRQTEYTLTDCSFVKPE